MRLRRYRFTSLFLLSFMVLYVVLYFSWRKPHCSRHWSETDQSDATDLEIVEAGKVFIHYLDSL